MRAEAKIKGGFYPTPPRTLYAIERLLRPADGAMRIADPCAGKGEALEEILWALKSNPTPTAGRATVTAYAVEPQPDRYYDMTRRLGDTNTIMAHWEEVTCANGAFSLLFLNPPYDYDALAREEAGEVSHKNRVEYTFLQRTLPKLQTGGVLVFIIPHKILGIERVAKMLTANFEDIRVYSLPDGEYDLFDQCVIFGYRRSTTIEDPETAKALMRWGTDRPTDDITTYDPDNPITYLVPASTIPNDKMIFRRTILTYAQSAEIVYREGAAYSQEWQRIQNPIGANFVPATRLRLGHIGPLLSSGQLGTVNLGDMLIRGAAAKELTGQDENNNPVDMNSKHCASWIERFSTAIYCLHADGTYKVLTKPHELRELLEKYGSLLHEIVQSRYPPLYNGPTVEEWNQLGKLMKKKKLPGRREAGLLVAQKHIVCAATRVLREKKTAIIVGEMGTGKGPMQLACAELLNAYPLAIATPAHMVEKFEREARDTIPGAKPVIVDSITQLNEIRKAYKPGDKLIIIASYQTWKEGPLWTPGAAPGSKLVEIRDEKTRTLLGHKRVKIMRCPRCGAEVPAALAITSKRKKKKRQVFRCKNMVPKWDPKTKTHTKVPCNEKLMQFGPLHKWPLAHYVNTHMPGFIKMIVADEIHKTKAKGTNTARAFQHLINSTKYALGGTGTLFGGKSTDLFFLLFRMDPNIRRQFGFNEESAWSQTYGRQQMILSKEDDDYSATTGRRRAVSRVKELPGISPAIYARVFERCVFLKVSELGFTMPPYAEEIERMLMAEIQREQYNWLYNTLYERIRAGVTSFTSTGMKEAMALMSVFLQNCLSRPNSGFRTERISWTPPDSDKRIPFKVRKGLSARFGYTSEKDAEAIWDLSDTDAPIVEPGAQNQRAAIMTEADEPDAPGTPKQDEHLEPMDLYPAHSYGELAPKEYWLLTTLRRELAEGNRVLLYVRQTAKRNIQPHLLEILAKAGIQAVILPDGDARTREAWIQVHTAGVPVMITNPKKVETGLDLVMFNRVIFYELDYSLFTIWQAMRRVWRLGQTKAVKVIIPIYCDAMEAHALSLMASKFQAALLLYGDPGAGLAEEADTQDIMAELARQVLEGQITSPSGIQGLLAQAIEAEMQQAQPTEDSPSAEDLAKLLAELEAADGTDEADSEEDEEEDDESIVDGQYTMLDDIDDSEEFNIAALPIFAAAKEMAQEMAQAEADTLTPTILDMFALPATPAETPTEAPATPEPAPAEAPAAPIPVEPHIWAVGDSVKLKNGRTGTIVGLPIEGYAAVKLSTGLQVTVALGALSLIAGAEAQTPAKAATSAKPEPKTTPAWEFWNFEKQTDPTTGITSISLGPKEAAPAKSKKRKGSGAVQTDMFAFLNTDPFAKPKPRPGKQS